MYNPFSKDMNVALAKGVWLDKKILFLFSYNQRLSSLNGATVHLYYFLLKLLFVLDNQKENRSNHIFLLLLFPFLILHPYNPTIPIKRNTVRLLRINFCENVISDQIYYIRYRKQVFPSKAFLRFPSITQN